MNTNMMIIENYLAKSDKPLAAGQHQIEIQTRISGPGKAGDVVVRVDGKQVATTRLERTVAAAFTATETFDVGVDLGSTVSQSYFDRRPFAFAGRIESVQVQLASP